MNNIEDALNTINTWQGCMEKTYSHNDFAVEYLNAVNYLKKYIIENSNIPAKETPMKVIGKCYEYQYCPRCKQEWKGWDLFDGDRPKYCDNCGQRLKWDNYEEDDEDE